MFWFAFAMFTTLQGASLHAVWLGSLIVPVFGEHPCFAANSLSVPYLRRAYGFSAAWDKFPFASHFGYLIASG